jgi:uncharacterized oxidoreductase
MLPFTLHQAISYFNRSRLISKCPDAKEIQVKRMKFLRYAEARGDYDRVVQALNGPAPHGR